MEGPTTLRRRRRRGGLSPWRGLWSKGRCGHIEAAVCGVGREAEGRPEGVPHEEPGLRDGRTGGRGGHGDGEQSDQVIMAYPHPPPNDRRKGVLHPPPHPVVSGGEFWGEL